MKNLTLIGSAIFTIGLIIFFVAFYVSGCDISKLNTQPPYKEKIYISSSEFSSIKIEDSNNDIVIRTSHDEKIHITYNENEKEFYQINDTSELAFKKVNDYKWYDNIFNINIDFKSKPLTILLPKNYSGDLNIKTSNGSIKVENISISNLGILTSNGEIDLNTVKSSGFIEAKTSNAEVNFTNIDAKDIAAKSSNKNIKITKIKVTNKLHLKTSNADITGSVIGKMAGFSITSHTSIGENNLPGNMSGGNKLLDAKTSNGNIDISFEDN